MRLTELFDETTVGQVVYMPVIFMSENNLGFEADIYEYTRFEDRFDLTKGVAGRAGMFYAWSSEQECFVDKSHAVKLLRVRLSALRLEITRLLLEDGGG